MKKRAVVLLLCMAMSFAAGCGSNQQDTAEGTEAVESLEAESGTETKVAAYDIEDYVELAEDYRDVEVTIDESAYEVTDEKVDAYAEQIITYYKPYVEDASKTVVEKGDVVDVDYVGKLNGEAFEGGSAQSQLIDTGSNTSATMGTGYIEGFSDGLIGAKLGETVDSEVTFPEDYHEESLKGKKVTFTFTINAINEKMTLDKVDDAFVKENLQVENVEEFFAMVREDVTNQMALQRETEIRNKVLQAVTNKCTVAVFPEGMLETRVEEYIAEFEAQYVTEGSTLEEFLQNYYGNTLEEFTTDCQTYVSEILAQELVFEAIVKKENIEFVQEEFDQYVEAVVSNGGYESAEAVYEKYGSDVESGEEYLRKLYLQNKACGSIAEQAKIINQKAEETTEAAEENATEAPAAEAVEESTKE